MSEQSRVIHTRFLGLQYGSTNNPILAEKFFKEAIALAPDDPFVLAEMGSLYTQTNRWEYALSYLQNVRFTAFQIIFVIYLLNERD